MCFVRSSLQGLMILGLLFCCAYGQSNLATVTGVVTDTANAVMPGVTVTIRNVDTNIARKMQTNQVGLYTITNLPPGNYVLTAEAEGFRTYRKTGIILEVGQALRNNVRMELGAVTESVTVSANVVTVNTESGTIKGDVIVQDEIPDLLTYPLREMSGFRWRGIDLSGERGQAAGRGRPARSAAADGWRSAS